MKRLMILNAPEDHTKAATLKRGLTMMIRNSLISIVEEVSTADIVVVLLSNDMPGHDPTWAKSEEAKRRRAAGSCRVLPILVEPMAELPDHLVMLLTLPRHGKPAKTEQDWADIAGEIRAVAMKDAV
jgi:hypothetical protein